MYSCSSIILCSALKVPEEKVKEITEYSRIMLEKMEKARIEANYNEVKMSPHADEPHAAARV